MRRALVVSVSLTAALVMVAAARQAPLSRAPLGEHQASERVRLRAHFDSVDAELRARDVAGMSSGQRAARATLVSWLRDYRNGGAFPLNDRVPAHSVPIFRDARGVLCAMAYLIDRSGRRDIVARVAANRNNAYIVDLAGDARLVSWLDSVGLSSAEAARVQPSYGPYIPYEPEDVVSSQYAFQALALTSASVVLTVVNLPSPSRFGGIVGVLTGGLTLASGLSHANSANGERLIANFSSVAGMVSILAGFRALLAAPPSPPAAHASPAVRSLRGALSEVSLVPDIVESGGTTRVGLTFRARF